MDTLTHTVLGACLGDAMAGRQIGKKAMLIGAVLNNLPDIDVVSHFFKSPAEELMTHRGITHSILACSMLGFVLGRALLRVYGPQGLRSWQAYFLVLISLFLHITLDACTSYGTGWFEPFSHYRVSFNTLFILDPFFMLPMLVGAIALLIIKKKRPIRKKVAQSAMALSAMYLLVTIAIKTHVNAVVSKDLAAQNIPFNNYMTAPTPLNNLLWNVVTENDNGCYTGYYSVFDRQPLISYENFSKNDSLLDQLTRLEEIQILRRFSKNFYCISKTDSSLVFNDLRFGQAGGWYMPRAPFVFNFDIFHKNNAAHIQQGRMASVGSEPIKALVTRIKGN